MSSTKGRTKRPLQVEVGRRYILRLPRSRLPYRHQLYELRQELQGWCDRRHWVKDIPEAEPLQVNGADGVLRYFVVTVRATTVIPPTEPAVVIHLTRRPHDIQARIELTEAQIIDLNLGLKRHGRYVIDGDLFELHGDEDVEVPDVVQERDFVIPVNWLRPLDSVRAWKTKADQQLDLDLLALSALPENAQEWLKAEKMVQEDEARLQTRIEVQVETIAWVRDEVPAEERPGWQDLLEQRQEDCDSARQQLQSARQRADRLRELLDGDG